MSTRSRRNSLFNISRLLHTEPESGSALVLVLAIIVILTILSVAALDVTNSSTGLSGTYYGNSTAQLASQAGVNSEVATLNNTGTAGAAPNYGNYPCGSSGSISNAEGVTERYITNIVYANNGNPISGQGCQTPTNTATASDLGNTFGSNSTTPTEAIIYSTGWIGNSTTSLKNTQHAATTVATVAITDQASTVPTYAIYAGKSFTATGNVAILPGQGQPQPSIYANTVNPSGTFQLGAKGSQNTTCTSGANVYIGSSGSNTQFNTTDKVYGCIYSNGQVTFDYTGSSANEITSYYSGSSGTSIFINDGASVQKAYTYYGKNVQVQSSNAPLEKNSGGSPSINLVANHQPAPQPVPISSNANSGNPMVFVPSSACGYLTNSGTSKYDFTASSGNIAYSSSTSSSNNAASQSTYSSGTLDVSITPPNSTQPTVDESVSSYLNSINTVEMYNWPNGEPLSKNNSNNESLLEYLINSINPNQSATLANHTLTIFAPGCSVVMDNPSSQAPYQLGTNVSIFTNTFSAGNGTTITIQSSLSNQPTLSNPTLSIIAYPSNTSNAGIDFVTTGGSANINDVNPFFWTSGSFASANSTKINAQIYAEQNVYLAASAQYTFFQVNGNVLHFLGKPVFTEQSQYLKTNTP